MLIVNKLIAQGRGLAGVLLKRAAQVELDWEQRQRHRFEAVDSQQRALDIRLPEASVLRGGDVLVADDGSLLRVVAASQPVLEVRWCRDHGSAADLLRAAYQLGQRHVPLALDADVLRIQPDAELGRLLQAQHLIVAEAKAAFDPVDGGLEDGGHGHHHYAHHGHDHAHGHNHDHGHDHPHHHDGDHDHGDHDHDHGHDHGGHHGGHHGHSH